MELSEVKPLINEVKADAKERSLEIKSDLSSDIDKSNDSIDRVDEDLSRTSKELDSKTRVIEDKTKALGSSLKENTQTTYRNQSKINSVEKNLTKQIDESKSELTEFRSEVDKVTALIRAETDESLSAIKESTTSLNEDLMLLDERVKTLESREDLGVVSYTINNCPKGWYELNGQEINDEKLRDLIQSYSLPDLRGKFIRANDANREVLSLQPDATARNGLFTTEVIKAGLGTGYGNGEYAGFRWVQVGDRSPEYGTHYPIRLAGIDSRDVETRPENISLKICIKGGINE